MNHRQKIAASQLQEGMYVAELDRPWLETPFLFQGFIIRSERQIRELCQYCSWVWVDAERSEADMPPDPGSRKLTQPRGLFGRALDKMRGDRVFAYQDVPALPSLAGLGRTAHRESTRSVREELPDAERALAEAETLIRDVTNQLRMSDTLKFSMLREAVDPVIDSVLRNKDAMIWLQNLRGKGEYMFSRSVACSVWGVIFGRHLGLDRDALQMLATGGLLLDVGKTEVPDELLTREGPLNDAEMAVVREHVEHGAELLRKQQGVDGRIVEMVLTHHERFNGTGYPKGLSGTQIPPLGKIAGILDSFVAMTSKRPYADAMSTSEVMRHLTRMADVEFQGELVEQFIQAVGVFPTGSLVELSTGQVAIVTEQNRVRRLRPKVMVVTDPEKQILDEFRALDLREENTDDSGEVSLWIAGGLPPGAHGIDPEEFFL